jgi:DNA-binding LacI/PurR family transcriptional regulator
MKTFSFLIHHVNMDSSERLRVISERDRGDEMTSIVDVARRAGVSQATVSRVIAGKAIVSTETREKVMQAVDELGYRPSSIGKALRVGRLDSIGLLVSDIEQVWYAVLAKALQNVLRNGGQDMLLFDLGHNEARLLQMLERALALRLQAVVLAISDTFDFERMKPTLASLKRAGIPVVSVGQRLDHLGVGSVVLEDFAAGMDAVAHLHARGRRRVAYLNRISQSAVGRRRYEGYLAGLQKVSIPVDEKLVWPTPLFRFEGGYKAVREAISAGVIFDAILAGTDELAIGAMSALAEQGLAVPAAVSVIGFGGFPVGSYVTPPLTTFSSNADEVAQHVADLVASANPARSVSVPRELLLRGSA